MSKLSFQPCSLQKDHIGPVWIASLACPAKISVVDHYRGPRLDTRQSIVTMPIFWLARSVFMPTRWQDWGDQIVSQNFGVPILAGLAEGEIQTGP
jgi:hypothetical protein